MGSGDYTSSIGIGGLSPAQRHDLEGRLRHEGINAVWLGDRVEVDQAYEGRVESLVEDARATAPGTPPYPGGGAPQTPYPAPGFGTPPGRPGGPPGGPPAAYGQPAYGYDAYSYGGYASPYAAPQSNGKATASIVLAICSFAVCGLCFIPAIILGHQARREIRESNGMQTGDGMAKAGIILGYVYIGLFAVVVLTFVILAATAPSSRLR